MANPIDYLHVMIIVHFSSNLSMLSKLARMIHCISATTSSVERKSSGGGLVMTHCRCSTNPKSLDDILFLRSVSRWTVFQLKCIPCVIKFYFPVKNCYLVSVISKLMVSKINDFCWRRKYKFSEPFSRSISRKNLLEKLDTDICQVESLEWWRSQFSVCFLWENFSKITILLSFCNRQ